LILSESFQKILQTPEKLEKDYQARVEQNRKQLEAERAQLSRSIRETKEKQKRVVGKLKLEMEQVRESMNRFHSNSVASLQHTMQAFKSYQEMFTKMEKESNKPKRELEVEMTHILAKSKEISGGIEEMKDILEQIKIDVTKRKCKPSHAHLKYVQENSVKLQSMIDTLLEEISERKPKRKKIWEVELQDILKEQKQFKEEEEEIEKFEDDLNDINELFETLQKVAVIQEKRKSKPLEFVHPEVEFEIDEKDRTNALFSAIKSVSLNEEQSEKRIKAMELAEKTRKIELASKKDDFEVELEDFVGGKKFKNKVGIEEIEKLRQQKDREAMLAS